MKYIILLKCLWYYLSTDLKQTVLLTGEEHWDEEDGGEDGPPAVGLVILVSPVQLHAECAAEAGEEEHAHTDGSTRLTPAHYRLQPRVVRL